LKLSFSLKAFGFEKLVADFIGTCWLVLGGAGSAVLTAAYPELGIGFVGVSLALGLTVLLTMANSKWRFNGILTIL
jgi:aquaporin Z